MGVPAIKYSPRLTRFILVGGANTAIDFGILLILKNIGIPVVTANICSSTIAFIFSFTANKKYTFKTTDTSVAREMTLFILFTLIGLWVFQNLIIHATLPFLTHLFNNSNLGLVASKLLATVVSMAWNYITYSRIVFKHDS